MAVELAVLGQIAVGGREQMLIDFRGLVSPKTRDHIWGKGEEMGGGSVDTSYSFWAVVPERKPPLDGSVPS